MLRLHVVPRFLVILCLFTVSGFASGASSNSTINAASVTEATATALPSMVSSFTLSPTLAAPGQFVNFSWASNNAKSFNVTPNIAQDEETLPLNASAYVYNTNGLTRSTTFQAFTGVGGAASSPTTATLIIVPASLSASRTAIAAGQSVTLYYGGPNNNSTWELHASYNDNPIPLAHTCSGNTCSGSYETGPLAAAAMFSVSLTGPECTGGEAYSRA